MPSFLQLLLLCLLLFPSTAAKAQPAADQLISRDKFGAIDLHVSQVGAMPAATLRQIVDSITLPCKDELCMLRAIWFWESKNIVLNKQASTRPAQAHQPAWIVLRDRAANSQGYANLFQAMCDLAHISCTTVSGVGKSFPADLNKSGQLPQHYWNIVRIGALQYYIDAAWSAGLADADFSNFDPRLWDDGWFMTQKRLFDLSHYPDNKVLREGMFPVSRSVFLQSPVVRGGAAARGVFPFVEARGKIRGRQDGCLRLQYYLEAPEKVNKVYYGNSQYTAEKEAEGYIVGNRLYVDIPLEEDGKQELWIKVDDRLCFGYLLEVSRRPARRK